LKLSPDVAQRLVDVSDATGIPLQELFETCLALALAEYMADRRKRVLRA
jgi:hypothetical protein